jgi:hypothetical protein
MGYLGPDDEVELGVEVDPGVAAGAEAEGDQGLRIDEGALSFVTSFCFTYGYSPYKRKRGRNDDKRPSSKPAAEM